MPNEVFGIVNSYRSIGSSCPQSEFNFNGPDEIYEYVLWQRVSKDKG